MLYRRVVALTTVVQQDSVAAVLCNGKAYGIASPLNWQPRARTRIAKVAEFPQLGLSGNARLSGRGTGTTKSRPQRQSSREWPVDFRALFAGKKIRTSHARILVRIRAHVIDFFLMTEPNRLEMLTQFLEQNPNDAFARYGLALEYSKLGQTETALQQFNKLLELHPDYTSGYFMAAQTLARTARNDEAKAMLQKGIESAKRTGNRHAQNEMQAMLDEL